MKPGKPMKRSAWPRKPAPVRQRDREPAPVTAAPSLRRGAITRVDGVARPVPKEDAVRSEAYRRLVALLPCKLCGIAGHSQAAHPNTNKGGSIKTDDRLCFPLCADRFGEQGCHTKFDQHALLPKATRRLLEPAWGADTRRWIKAQGLWPAGLPEYDEISTLESSDGN